MMDAGEVIGSYHDLWHVEQSFHMSKTDLAARPMFARTRDAIEAHLTIVFTALAVARWYGQGRATCSTMWKYSSSTSNSPASVHSRVLVSIRSPPESRFPREVSRASTGLSGLHSPARCPAA
jgi:hypothetical protein